MSYSRNPQGTAYQGYPYVNPIVVEAPSLNPAEVQELAKWQNLPKRVVQYQHKKNAQSSNAQGPSTNINEEIAQISRPPLEVPVFQGLDLERPVVYIDIPDGPSGVCDRTREIEDPGACGKTPGSKEDEETPVVYIDIPESGGSGVSQANQSQEPSFVQDTILFDPFKGRRIELPKDPDSLSTESDTSLSLNPSGSSGYGSSLQSSTLPPFSSKETYIYRRPTPTEDFSLTPLPVNEYPDYPPPYEEIDNARPTDNPRSEPPRTQVITPNDPRIISDNRRKVLTCQHCDSTVHTLVILENGCWTHILACLAFIICFPLGFVIYCTDYFKYKNHYCPTCNKRIGYQNPVSSCFSDNLTFITQT